MFVKTKNPSIFDIRHRLQNNRFNLRFASTTKEFCPLGKENHLSQVELHVIDEEIF